MSEQKHEKNKTKQSTEKKNKPSSHSGIIALLVMAIAFIVLQFIGSKEENKSSEITQLEFRKAVQQGQVTRVQRIQKTDSEQTFLLGEMKSSSPNAKGRIFKVVLPPRENEELMLLC